MIRGHRKRGGPQKNGKTDMIMTDEEEKWRKQARNRERERERHNNGRGGRKVEGTSP